MPVNRLSIPHLVLTLALALLQPLEQLHCACKGSQTHVVPIASHEDHSCCESPSAAAPDQHSEHEQSPRGCVCPEMAPILVPAVSAVVLEAPSDATLAVLAAPTVIAPIPDFTVTAPAHGAGSPLLPVDLGARGLRAPPPTA